MALKRKTKLIWQMVYIFGTLALIVFLGYTDPNFKNIGEYWDQFNFWWLGLGLLAIFLYWVVQAMVLNYTASFVDSRIPFRRMFKATIIGEYYCAITPFSTGGQPIQIAYMKRYGIGVAKATSIVFIRFVGFTFSLCAFYIVSMIFNGERYYAEQPAIFWVTLAGFLVNLVSCSAIVLIMINRRFVERAGLFFIKWISKIKIFRRLSRMKEKYLHGVEEFAEAAVYLKNNKLKVLGMLGLSLVSVFFMFSITYLVYRALGLTEHNLIDLMSLQIFLYLAVSFFPTPGALGASEGGFLLFFGAYFGSFVYVATILWRFCTYYASLLVGAGVVVADEVSKLRKPPEEAETQE